MSRSDGRFVLIKDDLYSDRPPRLLPLKPRLTVEQCVDMAGFDELDRELVRAEIDGVEVPAALWASTEARGSTQLALVPHGGDGDKVLRTVLTIAVVVAAFYIGGAVAGALGLEAGTAAYAAVSATASAVVTTVGNLAINAILPPPRLSGAYAADPDPLYAITGARNQLLINHPLQTVLGRHRVVPRLAARSYPEVRGDDTFYYLIFDLGPINVQVSDIRVDDTPIGEIDGAVWQFRLKDSDPYPSMASRQVIPTPIGALLGDEDWETRRTASDAIDADLILLFTQGHGRINEKGRPRSQTTQVRVRYRKVTNPGPTETFGPWTFASTASAGAIPFRGFAGFYQGLDVPTGAGVFTYTDAKPGEPFYRNLGFSFPEAATWEVSIQRASADGDVSDKIYDDIRFETLLSKREGRPVMRDDVAWGVIRFKGTDETNGVIDTVNMLIERLAPVFDEEALEGEDLTAVTVGDLAPATVTENPWELILWAARNGFYSRLPYQDDEIHWPSFAAAAKDARDRGLTFNYVVSNDVDVQDLIALAAFAGEGRCFRSNGLLHARVDRPQPAPSHFFREGTARNLSFALAFPQEVHAYRVTFNDAQDGYRQREVIVYVNGYTKETATRIETFSVAGKTHWDELHEFLQQQYRNSRRQTVTGTLEVPADRIDNSLLPMSWVSVASRVLAQARDTGRILSVEQDGEGRVISVKLDQPIRQGPSAGELGLRWVRTAAGAAPVFSEEVIGLAVPGADGLSETVTLDTPLSGPQTPWTGDEYIIGPSAVEIFEGLLDRAEAAGQDWVRLTLKAYAPDRYEDTGFEVPAYVPAYDLPANVGPPALSFVEALADERSISVLFSVPDGYPGTLAHFRVWRAEAAPADDPVPDALGVFQALPNLSPNARRLTESGRSAGERLVYRIQAVAADGRAGPVLQTPILTVGGALPAPLGFEAEGITEAGAGGALRPAIRVSVTPTESIAVADLALSIRRVALDGAGERLPDGDQPSFEAAGKFSPSLSEVRLRGVAAGAFYDVRGQHISQLGPGGVAAIIEDVEIPGADSAGLPFTASIIGVSTGFAALGDPASVSLALSIEGGSGNFNYTWGLRGAGADAVTVNNDSLQPTIIYTKTIDTGDPTTFLAECRVVDTDTGEALFPSAPITFEELA